MIDSEPTDREPTDDREDAPGTPADPPNHARPGDDADPAFDIDLDPDEQGTAEAGAEPTD